MKTNLYAWEAKCLNIFFFRSERYNFYSRAPMFSIMPIFNISISAVNSTKENIRPSAVLAMTQKLTSSHNLHLVLFKTNVCIQTKMRSLSSCLLLLYYLGLSFLPLLKINPINWFSSECNRTLSLKNFSSLTLFGLNLGLFYFSARLNVHFHSNPAFAPIDIRRSYLHILNLTETHE